MIFDSWKLFQHTLSNFISMKQLSFLLLFLIPLSITAQKKDVTLAALQNGDQYLKGVVNLKVKSEFRSSCDNNAIEIPQLIAQFGSLNFITLEKKFPRTQPPKTEFNEHGQKLADLSLIYKLTVPNGTNILAATKELSELPWVEYAEPSFISFTHYVPNDERLNAISPYHYDNINAYEAWDITLGDTNVVIGITETAIYTPHPDFAGNIKYNYDDPIGNGDDDIDTYADNFAGWDMAENDNNLFRNGEIHGDAVSAIASATADNNLGYAGIGFKCKFIPVKVAGSTSTITHGYEGIEYCVEQGASIVNCSWGNKTFSQVAQDVITWAAVNNDVVMVASAGNEDSEDLYYPASYEHVLSVTGVTDTDIFEQGPNTFSRNDSVDVSAPGIDIYTTAFFNGSALYAPPQGGTSMAAPIVSGVAALVRSQFPCLNAAEVVAKIKASADPIDGLAQNAPYAGLIGTGRVNAEAAVTGAPCTPLGIRESSSSASLDVYPNPASSVVNLRMSIAANWTILILDTQGRLVMSKTTTTDRTVIDGLATGMYVAKVYSNKHTFFKKFSVTTN